MVTATQKKALCYGQRFGHDFTNDEGSCSKCGENQEKLSGKLQKIEYFVKKQERGMHSEMHALAKEISEFCGEPKKFGMYLGIIKNIGLSRTYQIFAELKQGKEIKTPGKLFLYMSAYQKPKNSLKPNKKPLSQSGAKKMANNACQTPRKKYPVGKRETAIMLLAKVLRIR